MNAYRFAPLVAVAVAMWGTPARAVSKAECVSSHVEAQKLRNDGKLVAAREQLLVCASEECMKAVSKDCAGWLEEVNAAVPSVVIVATDAAGAETLDVRVLVNGELLVERLTGTALNVDPGALVFRFEIEGQEPIERQVVVREGERSKRIEVSFATPQPAAVPTTPTRTADVDQDARPEPTDAPGAPIVAYALGGVGVLALGGSAFFWLSSESAVSDLEKSGCAPACERSDVDAIEQKRLVGDILLGVGIASLGVATYLYLDRPSARERAAAPVPVVDLARVQGGALATVQGRF